MNFRPAQDAEQTKPKPEEGLNQTQEIDEIGEHITEERNELPNFPRREGSLPLPGRRGESVVSGLNVPRPNSPFRGRRATLATVGLGRSYSSHIPNGKPINRSPLRGADHFSDDESISKANSRRGEPVHPVPARCRSAEGTPRSQTPTHGTSTLRSAVSNADWSDGITGVGRLSMVLDFTTHTSKLSVTITKIEFPPYHQRNVELLEVSVMLLPGKAQSFRTKPKDFNEPVAMYLYPRDKVKDMSLRFRLYEHGAVGARHLLGEGNLRLRNVNLDAELIPMAVDLQSPGSYVPEGASGAIMYEGELAISEEDRPEILLSLEYRRLTGKLLLEVIKTRNLGMLTDSKAKEMYVAVKLVGANASLISRGKTTPRRHMIDPEYNEMFLFHVPEQELNTVTILLTVVSISKTLGRKHKVGMVALGENYSSEEELRHWYEMTRSKEKSIVRWHRINEIRV